MRISKIAEPSSFAVLIQFEAGLSRFSCRACLNVAGTPFKTTAKATITRNCGNNILSAVHCVVRNLNSYGEWWTVVPSYEKYQSMFS